MSIPQTLNPNGQSFSITQATAGTTLPFARGSFAMARIDATVNSVGLDISGTWAGTLAFYFSPDSVNVLSIANSAVYATATGTGGVSSGATGKFNIPCSGPGWIIVVASSYSGGPINLKFHEGSGVVPSAIAAAGGITETFANANYQGVPENIWPVTAATDLALRTAFQDAQSAGSGTLILAPGTYSMASALQYYTGSIAGSNYAPTSGIAIKGSPLNFTYASHLFDGAFVASAGTVLSATTVGSYPCFQGNDQAQNSSTTTYLGATYPISNISIERLAITGFTNGLSFGAANFVGCLYSTFKDLYIYGCTGWGTWQVNFLHCTFENVFTQPITTQAPIDPYSGGAGGGQYYGSLCDSSGTNGNQFGNSDFRGIFNNRTGTYGPQTRGIVFEAQGMVAAADLDECRVQSMQCNTFTTTQLSLTGAVYAPQTGISTSASATISITDSTPAVLTGIVQFTSGTVGGSGLSLNTDYYIVNVGTNTIQISATRGGSAITLASGGSGLTLEFGYIGITTTGLLAGMPINTTSATAGGYTQNQTYVVTYIIDSAHAQIGNNKTSATPILGTASASLTFKTYGYANFEIQGIPYGGIGSGTTASNVSGSYFYGIDTEGNSIGVYAEEVLSSTFLLIAVPGKSNSPDLCWRTSNSTRVSTNGTTSYDFDGSSTLSQINGYLGTAYQRTVPGFQYQTTTNGGQYVQCFIGQSLASGVSGIAAFNTAQGHMYRTLEGGWGLNCIGRNTSGTIGSEYGNFTPVNTSSNITLTMQAITSAGAATDSLGQFNIVQSLGSGLTTLTATTSTWNQQSGWASAYVNNLNAAVLLGGTDLTPTLYSGAFILPAIQNFNPLATARVAAAAATTSSVTTHTPLVSATFRVEAWAIITAVSASSIALTVTYTDTHSNLRTITLYTSNVATPALTAAATGAFTFSPVIIYAAAGSAITLVATVTGASITYDAGGCITQIGP
jgi:hypothetical protein